MNYEDASEILGVDKSLFPYSKFYLYSLYKEKKHSLISESIIDLFKIRRLKMAYDLLLSEVRDKCDSCYSDNNEEEVESAISFSKTLTKEDELAIAYYYILEIEDKELPEYLRDGADAYYYSLAILIPIDKFMKDINFYGGVKRVLKRKKIQQQLADKYNVSPTKIWIRLADIYLSKENFISKYKKGLIRKLSKKS